MSSAPTFTLRPNTTEDYLEFALHDTAVSCANAIRRIALSDIEIYAILQEDVQLTENTTPLHNEYISHRISLLPINQRLANLEHLTFYLCKAQKKDESIENDQHGIMDVTTDLLSIHDASSDTWVNPKDVFLETYLITKLNVKQKLRGSFRLKKGIAKDHARWQAVSTISYRFLLEKDLAGCSYDGISLEDERQWTRGENGEPKGFLFYVETSGIMQPRMVIEKSLEILLMKIKTFQQYVQTQRAKLGWTTAHMLDFEYEGEMHTLGNLLATMGLEQLGKEDFIGYRMVHPMMNKFILRMKIADSDSKDEHIDRLLHICEFLKGHVQQLIQSWKSL